MALAHMIDRDDACPYCGACDYRMLQRKHWIVELRRCSRCGLMFRWPKDDQRRSEAFYQRKYVEGMTTELPDATTLMHLQRTRFAGTEKDFAPKIELLKSLLTAGHVLDYGCSWGYGCFQLNCAGYETIGFEVSRPRANFARRAFGATIVTSLEGLDRFSGTFDAVLASHVLEHLPSLRGTFDQIAALLRPSGIFVAFVPNCGGSNARRLGVSWGPMCCEKHPLAFDAEFFERNLPSHHFEVVSFSDPYSPATIEQLRAGRLGALPRDGDELVICARRRIRNPVREINRARIRWAS